MPDEPKENLVITYGCQPSDGVPIKSTLAKSYFRWLRKSAKPFENKQVFVIPGCLNSFMNFDGKADHIIKVGKPMMLEWHFLSH